MFSKKQSNIFLTLSALFTLILLIWRPVPKFDYDFEQFFPQDNEALSFYKSYADIFGGDNDYLLLAFENDGQELWQPEFLSNFESLQSQIKVLEGVDTTISVLDLREPRIGAFGVQFRQVVTWDESRVNLTLPKNQLAGSLVSEDGNALLLLVKNKTGMSKEAGDVLYQAIREKIEESELKLRAVAGKIQTQGDFVKLMQSEFGFFFAISLVVMLLILTLLFRSWWGVVIPFVVLLIGVLWAFGVILWMGKPLALMSVMQPTIFLIVGLSALIHFFVHLVKKLQADTDQKEAIRHSYKQLFIPVLLTMMTTALGFFSLWFTSIPALQDFGLTTAIGIFMIFLAVIGISPGLLYLVSKSLKAKHLKAKRAVSLQTLFSLILKRRKVIGFGFLAMSIIAVFLGLRIPINGYLLDNLPFDHPIREDFGYFDSEFGGSNPFELSLELGEEANTFWDYEVLQEVQKLEEELNKVFGENKFISPITLTKTLNQSQNQGDADAFRFPSRGQFIRMQRILRQGSGGLEEGLIDSTGRISRISGRLPDFGSYKMRNLRSELDRFIQSELDSSLLKTRWTGTAYLIDQGHESVTWQMARGLGVAFLLVGLIAGILFRSWRISFLLLIPNVIPLLLMLAVMYFLGIEFKLTTAILFTVAFGIAVDDSIHFMTRFRLELGSGRSFFYAMKRTFLETGKAILLTTVVLVSGFVLFVMSDFGVTFYSGVLISCALIFALLADLMLLPLLLIPMKRVWEGKQNSKT
ncbi:efflux RND transporter permease subunit [Algoriphagus formosus]|uniref:RND transporter n=1 Tax=Algoriphagus formosus TaxID=2007308 RepID=A0A4R5V5T7_9BACT|nr:MMPL family transporter [Algoriphagus aquimaris]TDK47299.1 RND transporter [Algoriphagus aquimaris]